MKHEIPASKATIKELVDITCLWWTNICIICDLNERFEAPLEGFTSSAVAKGERPYDKIIFKIAPTKAVFKNKVFVFIIKLN